MNAIGAWDTRTRLHGHRDRRARYRRAVRPSGPRPRRSRRQAAAGLRLRQRHAHRRTMATAATPILPIRATGSTPPTRPMPPSPTAIPAAAPGTARASPGMIGALTNNAAGVAGLDWNSFILPVRVLGKCGGMDSDILAGMRWAAGPARRRACPTNPTPARILNLSLGSHGRLRAVSYRDVIDELTRAQGAGGHLGRQRRHDGFLAGQLPGRGCRSPRIRHAGSKVGFSNLGPEVDDRGTRRQLRERQRRPVPVFARHHLQQRHDGARRASPSPTRSTPTSAPVSRRPSSRASRR